MKRKPSKNCEVAIPGYKPNRFSRALKLNRAFQDALKVTRAYTLTRDVQDVVDAALQREKRNG